MPHRGPFQPLPFCDSVILWNTCRSTYYWQFPLQRFFWQFYTDVWMNLDFILPSDLWKTHLKVTSTKSAANNCVYLCPWLNLTVYHFVCKYRENVFSSCQIICEFTISKPCGKHYYLLYLNILLNSNSVHDYLGTSLPRISSHWCPSIALWRRHKNCMDERTSVLCGKNIKGKKEFHISLMSLRFR